MEIDVRKILLALLLPLAAVAWSGGTASSDEGAAINWEHDGLAEIALAAADAKATKRRLLIGLSGGAT